MIRLVILDFDGTLGDTRANIVLTMQQTLEALAYPVASDEVARCARTYREIFEKNRQWLVPALFPHVKETLARMSADGYVLTVASSRSSRSLKGFLHDMEVDCHISYVLGADNVSRAKPDPEPVLQTLRDLGYPAQETLVVGDMPVDILMGKRAGARTCAVTYGNASQLQRAEAGADHILDDFARKPSGLLVFFG